MPDVDIASVFTECLRRAKRRFPKSLPSIFDEQDLISAWSYGFYLGWLKVDWNRGDPLEFLIANGIFYMRTLRYRTLAKKNIITCAVCGGRMKMSQKVCGKKLRDDSICSGTEEDRQMQLAEVSDEFIENRADYSSTHSRRNGESIPSRPSIT